jgi:hypothetical protein
MTLKWSTMQILINSFGEPNGNYEQRKCDEIKLIKDRFNKYSTANIAADIDVKNIGKGADWEVISISIPAIATALFFTIPAVHKKIRESIEEWQRISNEFKLLVKWMSFTSPVYYSEHFLFLTALASFENKVEVSNLIYLGCKTLPEDNPSLQGLEDLIFNFKNENTVISIAVSRDGNILWNNGFEVSAPNAIKQINKDT